MELKEKTVRAWSGPKIQVGYCDLQNLLRYAIHEGYTAGVYGWNMDVYSAPFKGGYVTITTGYRRMIGRKVKYDLTHEYDNKARAIIEDWNDHDYEGKKVKVNALLTEYLEKALAD